MHISGIPPPPLSSGVWKEQDARNLVPGSSFYKQWRGFAKRFPPIPQVSTLFALEEANKLNQTAQEGGGQLPAPAGNGLLCTAQPGISRFLSFFRKQICYHSHGRGLTALCCDCRERAGAEAVLRAWGAQPLGSWTPTSTAATSNPISSDLAVPIPATHRDQDPRCSARL